MFDRQATWGLAHHITSQALARRVWPELYAHACGFVLRVFLAMRRHSYPIIWPGAFVRRELEGSVEIGRSARSSSREISALSMRHRRLTRRRPWGTSSFREAARGQLTLESTPLNNESLCGPYPVRPSVRPPVRPCQDLPLASDEARSISEVTRLRNQLGFLLLDWFQETRQYFARMGTTATERGASMREERALQPPDPRSPLPSPRPARCFRFGHHRPLLGASPRRAPSLPPTSFWAL